MAEKLAFSKDGGPTYACGISEEDSETLREIIDDVELSRRYRPFKDIQPTMLESVYTSVDNKGYTETAETYFTAFAEMLSDYTVYGETPVSEATAINASSTQNRYLITLTTGETFEISGEGYYLSLIHI